MEECRQTTDWAGLPDHIIVSILCYLPQKCRHKAGLVCTSWHRCYISPSVWSSYTLCFYMPLQARHTEAVEKYGKYMKYINIEVDQSVTLNRENASKALKILASLDERRLKNLKITFTGINPYFYAGIEFVDALMELFGPVREDCKLVHHLQELDFSGLTVAYDDKLFNTLSENHPRITKLNIQNKVLVCKVTHTCLLRLVQRCRKLTDLKVYHVSLSEDVLLAFTEKDRAPLRHLSIICRREEKYFHEFDDASWKTLSGHLPNLRVSFGFDHTCPFNKISQVLTPSIPVSVLNMDTFTYIYDEIRQAASYYKKTLTKLVLQTPLSRNSPELNKSLIYLAEKCLKLEELYVYCVLGQETVDKILEACPKLKESKAYVLKV